jgi:hypothetical protein
VALIKPRPFQTSKHGHAKKPIVNPASSTGPKTYSNMKICRELQIHINKIKLSDLALLFLSLADGNYAVLSKTHRKYITNRFSLFIHHEKGEQECHISYVSAPFESKSGADDAKLYADTILTPLVLYPRTRTIEDCILQNNN